MCCIMDMGKTLYSSGAQAEYDQAEYDPHRFKEVILVAHQEAFLCMSDSDINEVLSL